MKKLCAMLEIVFAALTVSAMLCTAQLAPPVAVARGQTAPAPLKPLQNIPLLGVDGALDHKRPGHGIRARRAKDVR